MDLTGAILTSPTKIPLSCDWGRSISPKKDANGVRKTGKHQFHNWVHEFPVASPPKKSRSPYISRTTMPNEFQASKTFQQTASATFAPTMPRYVKTDKVCLRFYGYFQESVNDSNDEISRVRPVILYYFVVDDSIQIVEPKSNNSGMPQGALVKRHRVPKPDCTFYSLSDLTFGAELEVYGKIIRITDADEFTKTFCRDNNLGTPESLPPNMYDKTRWVKDHQADAVKNKDTAFKDYVNAMTGAFVSSQDLGNFLDYDGIILKFRGSWDGKIYTIKYFMATSDMEITEDQIPGKGKLDFPRLIRRQKVPKHWTEGPDGPGGLDKNTRCWNESDLRVGAILNIYGRDLLIIGSDDTTRKWYWDRGIDIGDNLPKKVEHKPVYANKIPERTAATIGTDEDTIQSCLYLVPPKPKKDEAKLLKNDGLILRFKAQMVSNVAVNKVRTFVVRFFLANDTIMVFEQPVANLGVPGGKFVERRLLKKRDNRGLETIRYSPLDFTVGKQIEINKFKFNLLGCDGFTRKYYEEVVGHPQPTGLDFTAENSI